MSFSRRSSNSTPDAVFEQYNTYEVASSLTTSKYIANDISNNKRYAYRATATLVGVASVRPYDPIYLDGLSNGMAGYWTVLSVKHIFNSRAMEYMLEVELGTDILGDVDPTAGTRAEVRDVQGELSGQSISLATSILEDIPMSVNDSSLIDTDYVAPTASVVPGFDATPTDISLGVYAEAAPTPSKPKNVSNWRAGMITI
jgi:hypothetical protein